jgi:hypothetical protein
MGTTHAARSLPALTGRAILLREVSVLRADNAKPRNQPRPLGIATCAARFAPKPGQDAAARVMETRIRERRASRVHSAMGGLSSALGSAGPTATSLSASPPSSTRHSRNRPVPSSRWSSPSPIGRRSGAIYPAPFAKNLRGWILRITSTLPSRGRIESPPSAIAITRYSRLERVRLAACVPAD